jgi:hypothetical protein
VRVQRGHVEAAVASVTIVDTQLANHKNTTVFRSFPSLPFPLFYGFPATVSIILVLFPLRQLPSGRPVRRPVLLPAYDWCNEGKTKRTVRKKKRKNDSYRDTIKARKRRCAVSTHTNESLTRGDLSARQRGATAKVSLAFLCVCCDCERASCATNTILLFMATGVSRRLKSDTRSRRKRVESTDTECCNNATPFTGSSARTWRCMAEKTTSNTHPRRGALTWWQCR